MHQTLIDQHLHQALIASELLQLACAQQVNEGNSGHQDVAATPDDVRRSQFATRSAADSACAQALGTGYRVAQAGSLGGVVKLAGGKEYWVHNDLRPAQNCWAP